MSLVLNLLCVLQDLQAINRMLRMTEPCRLSSAASKRLAPGDDDDAAEPKRPCVQLQGSSLFTRKLVNIQADRMSENSNDAL